MVEVGRYFLMPTITDISFALSSDAVASSRIRNLGFARRA
jgi:hypothetical protein